MTALLYDSNPTLKTAQATVLDCQPTEKGFAVVLNQTVFFPEGGGQPGDTGTMDGVAVLDTYWDGDTVIHLCSAPLPVGRQVALALNWERRFDHMQQHTGEHILSHAFWHLFGAVNVGFHMNEAFGTVDLNQLLTPDQIRQAEAFANQQITADAPVHIYTAAASSLDKKRVRKISPKGGKTPRVVEIEGGDICTCCGTHVSHTGQVGSIAVTKWEKNRGGTRLTFLCGGRALRDHQEKTELLHSLTAQLSTDAGQLTGRTKALMQELSEARYQLKQKSEQLAVLQADMLLRQRGDSPYVLVCMKEGSPAEAKFLLNLLIAREPVTAIILYTKGESLSFLCGAHPHTKGQSCRTVCQLLCGIFGGKGGGKDDFAQGGAKAVADFEERVHTVLTQLHRMG